MAEGRPCTRTGEDMTATDAFLAPLLAMLGALPPAAASVALIFACCCSACCRERICRPTDSIRHH